MAKHKVRLVFLPRAVDLSCLLLIREPIVLLGRLVVNSLFKGDETIQAESCRGYKIDCCDRIEAVSNVSKGERLMPSESFSVRIFLQDGHVDGVKVVARSKWSGRALVIPRSSLPEEIGRDELNAPGVYVLIGPSDQQGRETIYIGAADPISSDLEKHANNKSFWTWTIICASKHDSLMQEHIEYIKTRLIQLAQETGTAILDNQDPPELSPLDGAEADYAEAFLGHSLSIYPVLGLRAFE